jgi:uncharacterized cupredoxin-like copper-binding protein
MPADPVPSPASICCTRTEPLSWQGTIRAVRRGRYLFVVALAAVLAGGAYAAVSRTAARIPVTEKEWGVTPRPVSAKAGSVTFVVKNIGHLKHEFVVLKTRTPAAKLKTSGAKAVITGQVGKILQFGPGQTRTLTRKLAPGHYVLLCNLPAHYQAGQRTDFTVHA